MAVGFTLFILSVLIIAIWVIIEVKRLRHKIFAIFLIVLILFSYISFAVVLKGHNVDLKTISGMATATKLYFSWLFSIFGNLKTITNNAIHMDWSANESVEKADKEDGLSFFR